ncbi:hypothetical protein OJ997_21715 [Solirubrobacter phytolaccae]|uniref:Uncharacterized protein n=1 Tax=Solirubrobacter phytolaccae TaxID=1404360 RepID=A0A9X3SCV6_9ACTN|nr:hypothetical protein [Solirubrobacter phytolaccae]MDA0182945.1 hypothetical protein [Solirubrobacter phytolaccae]
MSDRGRRTQNAVRDQLVAAAVREHQPRRRRRRLRVATVLVVAGLGIAAGADATGLLRSGEPLDQPFPGTLRDASTTATDGPRLAVSALDATGRRWGVGAFRSRTGRDCVTAGLVIGTQLGIMREGRFHPYGKEVTGVCFDLERLPSVRDLMPVRGEHPVTLVFGRGRPSYRPAPLLYDGRRYEPTLGRDGSFLFVIDGIVAINRLREETRSPAEVDG